MTVEAPTRRRRGRPPKEEAAPESTNGVSVLDKLRSQNQYRENPDTDHGQNLDVVNRKEMILCDYEIGDQAITSDFRRGDRDSKKVLMWLKPATEEAAANHNPRNPRKGAELFHAFSGILANQIAKYPTSELPMVVMFVDRPHANGRIDPETGDPLSTWTMNLV